MSVVGASDDSGRKQYAKTAQRRAQIIEAASAVFSQHGYHGASMRDIARRVDVSVTSVVHHFPRKADLLQAVLESADAFRGSWFLDLSASSGFRVAVLARVSDNLHRAGMLRLLAMLSSEATDPGHPAHAWFAQRYRNSEAFFTELIKADQRAGRVDDAQDPQVLARLVIAMWDGLQLQWLLDPRRDMVADVAHALDAIVR